MLIIRRVEIGNINRRSRTANFVCVTAEDDRFNRKRAGYRAGQGDVPADAGKGVALFTAERADTGVPVLVKTLENARGIRMNRRFRKKGRE